MAINEDGCESAGSAFRLPPRAGFCKLPSSFHLMQPSYPLLQAMRHLGRISAAFLPVPAGGPRRRVCEAWPHRPSPPEAGGSARLGGTGCNSQAKADAEVGKEWGSQLGAAGRASLQAATPRNPFVLLTWKAVRSRWGGGSRGETTRRGPFRVQWGR